MDESVDAIAVKSLWQTFQQVLNSSAFSSNYRRPGSDQLPVWISYSSINMRRPPPNIGVGVDTQMATSGAMPASCLRRSTGTFYPVSEQRRPHKSAVYMAAALLLMLLPPHRLTFDVTGNECNCRRLTWRRAITVPAIETSAKRDTRWSQRPDAASVPRGLWTTIDGCRQRGRRQDLPRIL